MKKTSNLFVALMFLTTLFMLTSCGEEKNDEPVNMNTVIAGTWKYVNPAASNPTHVAKRVYIFRQGGQGGTLTTIYADNSESVLNISNWNVDETNNRIVFGIIGESKTYFFGYRYSNNTLYLTFSDGFDYKFTR